MKEPLPPEIIYIYQTFGDNQFLAADISNNAEKKHHILWYINHKFIICVSKGQPAKYTLTLKTITSCQYQLNILNLPQLKASGLTTAEISRITNTSFNTVRKALSETDK